MELNIAVVSDLHCHHSSSGFAESLLITDAARMPASHHPVSALSELVKTKNIHADIILAPGDIANRADMQGMNSGWAFLHEIATFFGTPTLASTLGNHDVISHENADDPFLRAKALFPQFPVLDVASVTNFWGRGFYTIEAEHYRILVVNSAISHNNKISAKRGTISAQQLEDIEKYLRSEPAKKFQIGLCHHHPVQHEEIQLGSEDLMINGSLFVNMLSGCGFNLVVHGHKHHPRLRYSDEGHFPVFASGSFSAGLSNGLATMTRNLFHLITLNHSDTAATGTIRTWQFQHTRGWREASCASADFPHLTGFGFHYSPNEVANRIMDAFNSLNIDVAFWNEVSAKLPELNFVPPGVLRRANIELERQGLQLSPELPDMPIRIGRVS